MGQWQSQCNTTDTEVAAELYEPENREPTNRARGTTMRHTSNGGHCDHAYLLGHLPHRIATLTLAIAAALVSIDAGNRGVCEESIHAPNVVLILSDDK